MMMNKKVDEEFLSIKDVYVLQCTCTKLKSEIKRLRSIIKEAREYIKNIPDDEFVESEHFTELLEILRGESDENN